MSLQPQAYIRRETGVSMAINTALSLVFFMLVFGLSLAVPVWGMGAYVFDFLPQGFMIGLMATLVPGALAGKALAAGRVMPWTGRVRLPRALVPRALLVAVGSALAGAGLAAASLAVAGVAELPNAVALAAKLAWAAVLAAIVTPLGLRAALAR